MAIYINKLDMAAFKQLVLYGMFGVLTTLINIFTYWLMSRIFGVAVVPATIIAWTVAVLFAYCTNRKYVFHSSENSIAGIIHESFMFFMCRIGTGLLD